MFKLNLKNAWTTISASPPRRRLIAIAIALVCAATIAASVQSMRERTRHDEIELEKQLQAAADQVEERYRAGAQRFEDGLAKLRLEIRAQGIWNQYGLRPDPTSDAPAVGRAADPDAPTDRVGTSQATQLQRLDGLLSQRLNEIPEAQGLELIVASHDGLWARQYSRTPDETQSQPADAATSLSESATQELWFETGIQRAVTGSGRGVDWGGFDRGIEAGADSPKLKQRVAIAIHDSDGVVQGALVFVIDVLTWATQLERSSDAAMKVRLMSPTGRALTSDGVLDAEDERTEGRSVETALRPVSQPDPLALARVSRVPATDRGLASNVLPQTVALLLVAILGSISAFRLAFPSERVIRYEVTEPEAPQRDHQALDSSLADPPRIATDDSPPDAAPSQQAAWQDPQAQTIVLRDWLADVRTCLERKAATQGLGLDVACEHTLPEEVETDPVALGAILVSVGQHALAVTPNKKIRLTVRSDGAHENALRFEIDGGGVDLSLDPRVESMLAELGGRREFSGPSDFSLVLGD